MKLYKPLSLILSLQFILIGCSETKSNTSVPRNSISISDSDSSSDIATPIILSEEPITASPFIQLDDKIIFVNKNDNDRISMISEPFQASSISINDSTDFVNYSSDTLATIGNEIYFSDATNNNCLSSINFTDKTPKKLVNDSSSQITTYNNLIFFVSSSKGNKLFSYDPSSNTSSLITNDSVGTYLINGDFILYQNLSDNSHLYSIKSDGTQREQLTDFSVDSFTTYNNEILAINSSDNNTLYTISPNNSKSTRLKLNNIHNLKSSNGKTYFINNLNHLYSLDVNLDTSETTSKPILEEAINDYFLSKTRIFVEKMINVNNTYIINQN